MREYILINIAALLLIRYFVRKVYRVAIDYTDEEKSGQDSSCLKCFCSRFAPSDQICAAVLPFLYMLLMLWYIFGINTETLAAYRLFIPGKFSCTINFTLESGETAQIVYFFYRKSPDVLVAGLGFLFLSFFVIPLCNDGIILVGGQNFENMVFFYIIYNFFKNLVRIISQVFV